MGDLLRIVTNANIMLKTNKIRNIGTFLETQALFMAICEDGRELHKKSPATLRNLWPCFQVNWTDGDDYCEILVRLNNDGPLQDRDSFCPPVSRVDYFGAFCQKYDDGNFTSMSQIMTMLSDSILGEDEEGMLCEAFKKIIKERDSMSEVVKLDRGRLEWLANATAEEILAVILNNDHVHNRNKVVRMMSDFSTQDSICVVDSAGFILPLAVRNDKVVPGPPPTWLNDMTVRRSGRTIAHGNNKLNHLVDKTSYRRNNWAESKFQKVQNVRFRRETNQRRRNMNDAKKDRGNSEY